MLLADVVQHVIEAMLRTLNTFRVRALVPFQAKLLVLII